MPIAGGSAGGTDQILAGLLAQAGDVDPEQINYIAYSGGGESLAALLGNKVEAGISGVGEYAEQVVAGELRAWPSPATSGPAGPRRARPSPRPAPTSCCPTGAALMAHPGMARRPRPICSTWSPRPTTRPEWDEVLTKNGWDDLFLPGEEFATFLTEEENRVRAILKEIGL